MLIKSTIHRIFSLFYFSAIVRKHEPIKKFIHKIIVRDTLVGSFSEAT